EYDLFPKTGTHPASSAGQAFSGSCSGTKRKRPGNRGAPTSRSLMICRSGRLLGVEYLGRAVDRHAPRLHGLGDLAHEVDVEQPILEGSALDLDVVGELEAALESPRSDALIEHLAGLLALLHLLLAANGQRVFLDLDRQLGLGEAGYRDGNAIGVLTGTLDVVGRVARCRLEAGCLIEQREQTVEANRGTIEGSKIECTHGISSFERHAAVHHVVGPRVARSLMACAKNM